MGKPPFHLLLTCAGRKVSLVNQFRQAFDDLDIDGRIIGVDSSSHSAVLSVCDKSYIIPRCDHPAYVPTLLDVCERHRVQLLLPLIDVDLLVLGTVARRGISGFFLGNTAEIILSKVECSVLAVKPVGFVSPVKTQSRKRGPVALAS